jgi:hypothetical protein
MRLALRRVVLMTHANLAESAMLSAAISGPRTKMEHRDRQTHKDTGENMGGRKGRRSPQALATGPYLSRSVSVFSLPLCSIERGNRPRWNTETGRHTKTRGKTWGDGRAGALLRHSRQVPISLVVSLCSACLCVPSERGNNSGSRRAKQHEHRGVSRVPQRSLGCALTR